MQGQVRVPSCSNGLGLQTVMMPQRCCGVVPPKARLSCWPPKPSLKPRLSGLGSRFGLPCLAPGSHPAAIRDPSCSQLLHIFVPEAENQPSLWVPLWALRTGGWGSRPARLQAVLGSWGQGSQGLPGQQWPGSQEQVEVR